MGVASELKKTAATYGGKFAAKQVAGAVGSVIGGFFGVPELGEAALGAVGGAIAGEAISDHYSTPQWDGTYTHKCPNCGLEWHSSLNEQTIVSNVQYRKQQDEQGHIGDFFLGLAAIIILPVLTWACWYYCHTHETQSYSYDYFGECTDWSINWLWYILGLLMIVIGFAAIFSIWLYLFDEDASIWSAIRQHKKALKVRKMSLEEYYRNHKYLFDFKKPNK